MALRAVKEEQIEEVEEVQEEVKPVENEASEEEAANRAQVFTRVEAFLLDRSLFQRFCVVEGHSDMQKGERRTTMDQKEFLTMLRTLGVMEDSTDAPTDEVLSRVLTANNKVNKGAASIIFRNASGVTKVRKERGQDRRISQINIAELDFGMYCKAASAIARHLAQPVKSQRENTIVESTSGLKMERVTQARMSKVALAKKNKMEIDMSPLKRAMPKELEEYRAERRKLLFSNLPAVFNSAEAPPSDGTEKVEEAPLSDDPIKDQVQHFLCDKLLFLKYCMIEGHSALQSSSRQKSMDLHEFLHMLDEVGALKMGELGRGQGEYTSKAKRKEPAEGGEGRIPKVEGLERKLLTKKQGTNCFRAAMAQAKTQSLIAAGELNLDLYRIAAMFVAKLYVHGEPEEAEEEKGGKGGGRISCPPILPMVAPAHSNSEIYAKILDALPRPRPNGEDALLDDVEKLLLDPEIFEKFCFLEGHSSLQQGSRRSTMDQYEWFRCLADLGLMPAEVLRENKIVDPILQKREKKKPPPEYPDVVARLELRLTKEQASYTFRRALGKPVSKYGAPSGELNFRRYCVAVQHAAKLLVHGEDNPYPDQAKSDAVCGAMPAKTRRRAVEFRVKVPTKKGTIELPEWNERFNVRTPKLAARDVDDQKVQGKVSFNLSSDVADVTRAAVERVLSEKSIELAAKGDRVMLREEFVGRFATRDAFGKHAEARHKDMKDVNPLTPNEVLHEAVVDALQEAHLVPEFFSKETILEMLTDSHNDATMNSTGKPNALEKTVKFGADPEPSGDHRASAEGGLNDTSATRRAQRGNMAATKGSRMSGTTKSGGEARSEDQHSPTKTNEESYTSPSSVSSQGRHAGVSPIRPAVVSAIQETDKVRTSIEGPYAALMWPYAAFRNCFDHIATNIDLAVLEPFLQSTHAWCPTVGVSHAKTYPRGKGVRSKRQAPQTPWTAAHPTAAYRPRTSVRVLMLNQKELRRQHMQQQENRAIARIKQLEKVKRDLAAKETQEQIKEGKRRRWSQALEEVDRKILELRKEEEALLQRQEHHKVLAHT